MSQLESLKTADASTAADLNGIRAIFFDLDDTLCNYWTSSKKALHSVFESAHIDGYTAERLVQIWATAFREFAPTIKKSAWYPIYLKNSDPPRKEQMRRTLALIGIEDEALAQKLSDSYRDERNNNLELFEDAKVVLQAVKSRFPIGLITNGPADIQRMEIRALGLADFFDSVYIEGELGFGKPEAEVFKAAQAKLGFNASEILMVGNSYEHDIRGAINQGWKTVWIRRPSDVPPSASQESAPETLPYGAPHPSAIVTDLREILPMLGLNQPS